MDPNHAQPPIIWNEQRYRDLNLYFKEKLQNLFTSDPHLREQMEKGENLQLEDVIARLNPQDQKDWQEFLALDQLKMHQDLQRHLQGEGTPLNTQSGFYRTPPEKQDEEDQLW